MTRWAIKRAAQGIGQKRRRIKGAGVCAINVAGEENAKYCWDVRRAGHVHVWGQAESACLIEQE